MAKPVKNTPLMISIAERVGTTVGLIVAKTTDAVEGATKMVEGAAKSLKPATTRQGKRVAQPKAGTIRKKAVRAAAATTRKRKRPAKK
jgi:hypothetical protein